MPATDDFESVVATVLKTFSEALTEGNGGSDLADALAGVAAAVEAPLTGRPAACGPGCPYCCVVNVSVLLPEAAVIADWLRHRSRHSTEGQAELLQRLAAQAVRVRWMADDERIHRQQHCAFLDGDGACSIHPVRPLVCRAVTSLDRQACQIAMNPAELDADGLVPMDCYRKQLFDAAFCGVAKALERHGLTSRSIELTTGVVAFLREPGLTGLLLGGKPLPDRLWE